MVPTIYFIIKMNDKPLTERKEMNFDRQIPSEFTSYAVPDGNCKSIIFKKRKKKKRIFLNNLTATLTECTGY